MNTTANRQDLLERLGVDIDAETLRLALTHRSYAYEHEGEGHNERLEFLGDSVLGLAVTDEIYHRYPDDSEGNLAKIRAAIVSARSLADLARSLDLGPHIRLGKGEIRTNGHEKASILADTMEALIGAVYVCSGLEPARAFVLRLVVPLLEDGFVVTEGRDWKTEIQELAAARGLGPVRYAVEGTGPDHDRRYEAHVLVGGKDRGTGNGTTKKEAERSAAAQAYAALAAHRGA
ncbi:ribonuclease 3 [Kocuria dechangensis]|uniref:Ribonuclease 3 n=1 Tax=Kocuria dechangensis TaxID=1176249 RepID=A0A917H1L3_9MICC|nr:ribonuclease III [Kocuria dechangensis]GGG65053.1 ribonuclease 3 [Kocuria dechangensis]